MWSFVLEFALITGNASQVINAMRTWESALNVFIHQLIQYKGTKHKSQVVSLTGDVHLDTDVTADCASHELNNTCHRDQAF